MKIIALLLTILLSFSAQADISQIKFELMLAKRGDLASQVRVAESYESGVDVKKDLKEALKWYTKAANQSHAPSQYKVGYFHENALGTAKNISSAMTWYNKAKANGSDKASQRLDKGGFAKKQKAQKAQRLALQIKLDKEDVARVAKEKAAEETKAKELADKQKLAEKKAQAAKKKIDKKKAPVAKKKIDKKKAPVAKPVAKKKAPVAKKKAPAKVAVVKKKKKAKAVKIPNLSKLILNNKWKNKDGSADYLPSASTTCLEVGDELTCFSNEKSRKLSGTKVTYTTKSTLFGFKSNGSFKVVYNYNGIDVSGKKSKALDVYGLTMKKGWQEPAIAIKCKASDRKNLTCYRGNKKVKFRR